MPNRYGWKKDKVDVRDLKFSPPSLVELPSSVDLRGDCPPIYDQGKLGSCTANAIAGAFEFELHRAGMLDLMPSRLFIYYNEREMEGTVGEDDGAEIRDGMKSIDKLGVCGELDWPYDIYKYAEKPPQACYDFALLNRAIQYQSINQDLNHLKLCLADGFPFVFGMDVYPAFESQEVAKTGIVPMPGPDENSIGGHAVMCVGYDDSKQAFLTRNSWGMGWGLDGHFYLPYDYAIKLGSDFWTIRSVE